MDYKAFQDLQHNEDVESDVKVILNVGLTEVWFSRKKIKDFTMTAAERFDPEDPTATHVHIANVYCKDREILYTALQGYKWSPNGEANEFIRSIGATHTSLSCSDVLVIDGVAHVCMPMGWELLRTTSVSAPA